MTRPDQTRPDRDTCQKILLVTLYGNFNYGNVLQRYALTNILEGLGFTVEHLCEKYEPTLTIKERIIRKSKRIVKRILALAGVEKYRKFFQEEKRRERFREFQDKFTDKKLFMTYREILNSSLYKDYTFAVTGSDQVWHNWSRTAEELERYYLSFMPREKRVNYAPSFGFAEFSQEDYELHKKGLLGFERLSCREEEMIDMIRKATGQEAQLVLDPTLLLTPEQWRKVAGRPPYDVPEHYVLVYFLGELTPEYSQVIQQAANGLPIINTYDINDPEHYIYTNPGEFVYLIEHADFVCTNSFHGVAFSINFGKNFLFLNNTERRGMFGRVASILTSLNINNHVYDDGAKIRPDAINYREVHEKLGVLRESSMNYLRECLKV